MHSESLNNKLGHYAVACRFASSVGLAECSSFASGKAFELSPEIELHFKTFAARGDGT